MGVVQQLGLNLKVWLRLRDKSWGRKWRLDFGEKTGALQGHGCGTGVEQKQTVNGWIE